MQDSDLIYTCISALEYTNMHCNVLDLHVSVDHAQMGE